MCDKASCLDLESLSQLSTSYLYTNATDTSRVMPGQEAIFFWSSDFSLRESRCKLHEGARSVRVLRRAVGRAMPTDERSSCYVLAPHHVPLCFSPLTPPESLDARQNPVPDAC